MSNFIDASRMSLPVLKITGYADKKQSDKKGSVTLPFSQESLDVSYDACLSSAKVINSEGNSSFSGSKPSSLKVTFILDDTTFGTPFIAPVLFLNPKSGSLPYSVEKQIKKLTQLCKSPDSTTNKPLFLSIQSKNMPFMDTASGTFHGLLTNMRVKNELVDAFGDRIKARVECEFTYAGSGEAAAKSMGISPMLMTQNVLLLAGASLAAVAVTKYGSAGKTAKLAKKNDMDSVRKPTPGTQVKMPPASELDS
ncbi:hypothetical protein HQQ94_09580 [Shewanella sp. VB17]|uniref:CIS tube protein n=1 Tax=Shewanella sp. VB17 TaxID=2739432 RepID=UPI0015665F14|nr:hypothetical protein [Shewanella sp. VB17]NRD73491.1 hypothetical protein [Shewanella sp. VB17]